LVGESEQKLLPVFQQFNAIESVHKYLNFHIASGFGIDFLGIKRNFLTHILFSVEDVIEELVYPASWMIWCLPE
jgi:hypothetical protein